MCEKSKSMQPPRASSYLLCAFLHLSIWFPFSPPAHQSAARGQVSLLHAPHTAYYYTHTHNAHTLHGNLACHGYRPKLLHCEMAVTTAASRSWWSGRIENLQKLQLKSHRGYEVSSKIINAGPWNLTLEFRMQGIKFNLKKWWGEFNSALIRR